LRSPGARLVSLLSSSDASALHELEARRLKALSASLSLLLKSKNRLHWQ
jgi:hypothetical protein